MKNAVRWILAFVVAFTALGAGIGSTGSTANAAGPVTMTDSALAAYQAAGGRWIKIDLSQQRLYAYQGNTVVRAFVVSTGTKKYPTVRGNFRIYAKVRSQTMSGGRGADYYSLPNVQWVMYFYRGYSTHATYWHNNFGRPMSHGCVNMRTAEARWLYNWASMGTPVSVTD